MKASWPWHQFRCFATNAHGKCIPLGPDALSDFRGGRVPINVIQEVQLPVHVLGSHFIRSSYADVYYCRFFFCSELSFLETSLFHLLEKPCDAAGPLRRGAQFVGRCGARTGDQECYRGAQRKRANHVAECCWGWSPRDDNASGAIAIYRPRVSLYKCQEAERRPLTLHLNKSVHLGGSCESHRPIRSASLDVLAM